MIFAKLLTNYVQKKRQPWAWKSIVIDEAHLIKNENFIISQVVKLLRSKHHLL